MELSCQEKLFHSAYALPHFSPLFSPLLPLSVPEALKTALYLTSPKPLSTTMSTISPPILSLLPNSSLASSWRALSHRAFDSSLLPPFFLPLSPPPGYSGEVLYSPVILARAVKNTSGITLYVLRSHPVFKKPTLPCLPSSSSPPSLPFPSFLTHTHTHTHGEGHAAGKTLP